MSGSSSGSGYLPPPPPISPFRTSFALSTETTEPATETKPQPQASTQKEQDPPPPPPPPPPSRPPPPPPVVTTSASSSNTNGLNAVASSTTRNSYARPPNTAPPTMSQTETRNPTHWDREQVKEWLESIKCGHYFKVFEENHIAGDILLECDQQALKEMGIKKVGDRIRIHQALKGLRATMTKSKQKSLQQLDQESISPFINRLSPSIAHNTGSPTDGYFSSKNRRAQNNKQYTQPSSAPVTANSSGNTLRPQEAMERPQEKVLLSKQNTVKFIYSQGQSKTVNVSGCHTGQQIIARAVKKLNIDHVSLSDWSVHVADNELGTTTRQLSDDELPTVCHNHDYSERKRLMLCANGSLPTLKQLSKSQQILRDSLTPQAKQDDDEQEEDDAERTIFPDARPTSLNRLSGQRPPSELISSNLAHFFPEAGTSELNKTLRNSIRFSKRMSRMSRMSRLSKISNRNSIASYIGAGIPEDDEIPPVPALPDMDDNGTIKAPVVEAPTPSEPKNNEKPSEEDTIAEKKARRSIGVRNSSSTIDPGKRMSVLMDPEFSIEEEPTPGSEEWQHESGQDREDKEDEAGETTLEEITEERETETSDDDFFYELEEEEVAGPTRWIKGRLIGSGSFGIVYLGMNSFTGELMAVKQVELPSDEDSVQRKRSMVDALQREMDILRELQHENIVQYLGSNSEDHFLNIFLEYVPGGSVATMLANYGEFEEELIRNFVRQILQGLKYLHGQNIIHRDIKGANVLVDNKGCIKISDFGISKKLEAKLLTNRASLQGSVYWMAPEVVKQTSYTMKADIWSLGCLVIEMFSGQHPFPEFSQMQAIFRLGQAQGPSIPTNCSDAAQNFLEQTFAVDHTKRPSAEQLLKHEFMKPVVG